MERELHSSGLPQVRNSRECTFHKLRSIISLLRNTNMAIMLRDWFI